MIRLEPMTEADFAQYVERCCRAFATESPRYRGIPLDEAIKTTRDEFHTKIMPQGFHTPGHFLWSILDDHTRVGHLHLGETQQKLAKEIFAWDLEIFEPFRRKGFGRQAIVEAGKRLKELGYTRVALNVFGHNKNAIKLYEAMGFRMTQVQMAREIE